MDLKKIVATLHPLERKVVPLLAQHTSVDDLVRVSKLKEVEVTRALQWLENKKILSIKTTTKKIVELDTNGLQYVKKDLPERVFLKALTKGKLSIAQLTKKTSLTKDELNTCLGMLRKNAAIMLTKDKALGVYLTDKGKKLLKGVLPEEEFLQKQFPVDVKTLSAAEQKTLVELQKRKKLVKVELIKDRSVTLTDLGKKLVETGNIEKNVIDRVTQEILKEGSWKKKKFRRYDVQINIPQIHAGKLQPYRRFLDQVRQKFMSLGFTEMTGPIVETEFWNMDSLFMPQFHSARDIHDAYYVTEPSHGELDQKIVRRVKSAHESGGTTISRGWQYDFDVDRTHRHVLRTQGTACSSRMLANQNIQVPGKYFGMTRCFRNDVIDATHLADFNQTEGIIVEEGLNFKHLVSLLRMFAKEFAGTDEIRIVPGYFPFTEPSCELFAKHPQLGWIELGGAGIFRPEVTVPLLGKDVPVLAWGLGIDRIAMLKLGIRDIRQLFSHDLEYLRNALVI